MAGATTAGPHLPTGPRRFDLSEFAQWRNLHNNRGTWLHYGIAIFLVALWAVAIIPLFFEAPRSLSLLGKADGSSVVFPPSEEPLIIAVVTVTWLGGAVAILLSGRTFSREKNYAALTVTSEGIMVEFRELRPRTFRWNDRGLRVDLRDFSRMEGVKEENRSRPYSVTLSGKLPFTGVLVPREAFDSILEEARSQARAITERVSPPGRFGPQTGLVVFSIG